MTGTKLSKIKRALEDLRKSPQGLKSAELERYAKELGRSKDGSRGKEPTWVRKKDPALSPPLSIPRHSKDLKTNTARSIIDTLLSDCDDWSLHLLKKEDE